jgi:FkbM family methyltransferase
MKTIDLPLFLRWLQPLDFPRKLGICERLFASGLSKHGICWVGTGADIPWKLDLRYAPNRWIVYGKYEGGGFLNWAKQFLTSTSLVVDSGANIGQMLLYLAQWVPQGKVFAFEPGVYQAAWLRECLEYHPQLPVEILPFGLAATNTAAHLKNCGPDHVHGGWSQVSETEGEPIQLIRLSDFLAERHIKEVDLWKLDVEGFEISALEGARPLLEVKMVRAIYVELHAENGHRIKDYLGQLGYECYEISRTGVLSMMKSLPEHTNGLFLPGYAGSMCRG